MHAIFLDPSLGPIIFHINHEDYYSLHQGLLVHAIQIILLGIHHHLIYKIMIQVYFTLFSKYEDSVNIQILLNLQRNCEINLILLSLDKNLYQTFYQNL
jgi:hypothetical protein